MLKEGIQGFAKEIVTDDKTAAAVGSGLLPVYATPAMIALVEKAAWSSVADYLPGGDGTVGTRMDIRHVSATPTGMEICAKTVLTKADGRKLVFSAEVYDGAGLIGEGVHERFIVHNEPFLDKALKKQKS